MFRENGRKNEPRGPGDYKIVQFWVYKLSLVDSSKLFTVQRFCFPIGLRAPRKYFQILKYNILFNCSIHN